MRNVDCLVSPFEKRKLSPRGIAWGPSRGHSALLLVLGLSLPPSLGKICLGRFSSMNPFGRPFLALLKVGSTITSRAGVRVATVELIAGCPSEIDLKQHLRFLLSFCFVSYSLLFCRSFLICKYQLSPYYSP